MHLRRRMQDWPLILAAMLTDAAHRTWQWGQYDCCMFAGEVVHGLTGDDPLADLRGRWSTATQARALLKELGGLQTAVTERLGQPLAMPAMAQRGDIVMVPSGLKLMPHALAVCAGDALMVPSAEGLGRLPTFSRAAQATALVAWRV